MMQSSRSNSSRFGGVVATGTTTHLPPASSTSVTMSQERIRREFYATYDVMTGVRIAATLGGFFGLMVILIVYKSKSKTQKALNDPHLAAVAAEAVAEAEADLQEEEMALQAALEATAAWTMNPRATRQARQSLGNMSAPSWWTNAPRPPRFSSVGANLMSPPRRSYGIKSLPGSALRFHQSRHRASIDVVPCSVPYVTNNRHHFEEGVCHDNDTFDPHIDDFQYLNVNKRHSCRRHSSITCSSSDSSYLERRGSAVVGLPPLPPIRQHSPVTSSEKCWDFYYPIDIQVIQPTPDMSPCGSERLLYDRATTGICGSSGLVVPPARMAPLATISSCASSVLLSTDFTNDLDQRSSLGSDSVFIDDVCYDTDDEITQFSTDSEESSGTNSNEISQSQKEHAWKRTSSAPVQRRRKSIKHRTVKRSDSINLIENHSQELLNEKLQNLIPDSTTTTPCSETLIDACGSDTSTLRASVSDGGVALPISSLPLVERSSIRQINSLVDMEHSGDSRSEETLF